MDAHIYNIIPIADSSDIVVVELKPRVMLFRIEESCIVPPVESYKATQNVLTAFFRFLGSVFAAGLVEIAEVEVGGDQVHHSQDVIFAAVCCEHTMWIILNLNILQPLQANSIHVRHSQYPFVLHLSCLSTEITAINFFFCRLDFSALIVLTLSRFHLWLCCR